MMSAPEHRPAVDPDVLQMLADLQEPGEPDLLRELLTLFLRDTPERLEALRHALAAGDLESAGRAAHSLKGSAANLGAMDLHELASQTEQRARAADAAGVQLYLEGLDAEYRRVYAELSAVLSTRPH